MRQVTLAKSAGFCFGVKRAVNKVYEEAKKGRVYTYGPIIHNEEVVRDLEEKGVVVVNDVDELANSAIPLSESEYEELEPGGGDESVAILLSVGGYTKGERALIGAIGDAAMVQEKCTINDALYWLVKALDGHRYVIMANDTEDDGDSAHDIYIYNESFIRTGYLSGGDQIDIDELWSRLTNAS